MEGKKPFTAENKPKDEARKLNRAYYTLEGLKIQTKAPCPYCHRKSCKNRSGCKVKAQKKKESRAIYVERYFQGGESSK